VHRPEKIDVDKSQDQSHDGEVRRGKDASGGAPEHVRSGEAGVKKRVTAR